MNDGWNNSFEVALVFSQDTDLIEPIRILAQERGMRVGLVWLDGKRPNAEMARAASFVRHLSKADLAASLFPTPVVKADGSQINKPATW